MVLFSSIVKVGAPIAHLLLSTLVGAAPHEDYQSHARMGNLDSGFAKREDQDDTDADIAADGTGPIRTGM